MNVELYEKIVASVEAEIHDNRMGCELYKALPYLIAVAVLTFMEYE